MTVHVTWSWGTESARHQTDLELPPGVSGDWALKTAVALEVTGQREDAQYIRIRDGRVPVRTP
jgi:hypothetical protein